MAIQVNTDPRIAAFLADPSTITPENADDIRAALSATVGEGPPPSGPLTGDLDCRFNLGTTIIWSVIEELLAIVCSTITNLGEVLRGIVSSLFSTFATFLEDLIFFIEDRLRRIVDSVLFGLTTLVTNFEFLFNTMVDKITGRLGAAVNSILFTLDDVVKRISSFLFGAVSGIVNQLGATSDQIIAGVGRAVDTILNRANAVFDTVGGSVIEVVNRLTSVAADATLSILRGITNAVDSVTEATRATVGVIQNGIGAVLNRIDTSISGVIGSVESSFERLLDASTAVADRIESGITSAIAALVGRSEESFANIGGALTTLIETLTGAAESGLGAVRSVIEDIPKALRELTEDATALIAEALGVPLANMGTILVEQIEGFFGRLIDDLDVSPGRVIREFLDSLGLPPEVTDRFASAADGAMPITPLPFLAATMFIVPLLLSSMVHTVTSPLQEQLRQEVNKIVTPSLLPLDTALQARFLNVLSETDFSNELAQAGFNSRKIEVLLAGSRRLIGEGDLVRMWLRGLMSDASFEERLRWTRFTDEDIELIKEVVFFIPPVQDLITMAVREVFSPEIRVRFGLDEDFPTEFSTFARQQGVSEEWARNYWAAHWVLPSLNQGFEMLHRRVITADDLDLLMRTQDVMPFWRENLKDIAFSPLTRVDVRRMHDLGLISEDDLTERYMDLGFNEANADMMKAFTVAFNQDEPPELAELEGLTRSTILGMFDDGTLDEDETREIMLTLGIGAEATDLFIGQRLLERQRTERRDLIEGIIELATGAVIDLPEAQDSLARVGMTAIEIGLAVKRIIETRDTRRRLPSIAELGKMQLALIIDSPEWREAMGGHGFPDRWIERIEALDSRPPTIRSAKGVVELV